jgi:hypothetical protein
MKTLRYRELPSIMVLRLPGGKGSFSAERSISERRMFGYRIPGSSRAFRDGQAVSRQEKTCCSSFTIAVA